MITDIPPPASPAVGIERHTIRYMQPLSSAYLIKLISCFWSYKSLKNDQATRLFFLSFFLETKVERKWCTNSKMCCGGWGLDGEATECRLCKHCGCMLNTDYIWLHKSSRSEKIDQHVDQKQEINFVWPNASAMSHMHSSKLMQVLSWHISMAACHGSQDERRKLWINSWTSYVEMCGSGIAN